MPQRRPGSGRSSLGRGLRAAQTSPCPGRPRAAACHSVTLRRTKQGCPHSAWQGSGSAPCWCSWLARGLIHPLLLTQRLSQAEPILLESHELRFASSARVISRHRVSPAEVSLCPPTVPQSSAFPVTRQGNIVAPNPAAFPALRSREKTGRHQYAASSSPNQCDLHSPRSSPTVRDAALVKTNRQTSKSGDKNREKLIPATRQG